jgi:hypothetical protein
MVCAQPYFGQGLSENILPLLSIPSKVRSVSDSKDPGYHWRLIMTYLAESDGKWVKRADFQ